MLEKKPEKRKEKAHFLHVIMEDSGNYGRGQKITARGGRNKLILSKLKENFQRLFWKSHSGSSFHRYKDISDRVSQWSIGVLGNYTHKWSVPRENLEANIWSAFSYWKSDIATPENSSLNFLMKNTNWGEKHQGIPSILGWVFEWEKSEPWTFIKNEGDIFFERSSEFIKGPDLFRLQRSGNTVHWLASYSLSFNREMVCCKN